jgi:6-phospho-3-hexuloisomerase
MQTKEYVAEIIQELQRAAGSIGEPESEWLAERILRAQKIFTAGAGRSGLMMKAFAMRMMQMGLDVHVVGETVTPGLSQEDLLIIGSGSGETKSLVSAAQKAKSLHAAVAVITIVPESTIGKTADLAVVLPGSPKDKSEGGDSTIQPMGALFEQMLLVFCDAVILKLMDKRGLDSAAMYGRHANLEFSDEL